MDVLHVVGGLNRGGAETLLINIIEFLEDNQKINFDYLCYGPPREFDYSKNVENKGGHIHFVDYPVTYKPLEFIKNMKSFFENSKSYDLVHIHTHLQAGIVAYCVKKFTDSKVIVHSHSSQSNFTQNKLIKNPYEYISKRLISKYTDQKIACNIKSANYLFKSSENVEIVNNGLNINKNQDLKRKEISFNKPLILQVGRLEAVKNHSFSLDVFEQCVERGFTGTFLIAGNGSKLDDIKDKIRSKNLENHVKLLGLVDDVVAYMKAVDLLLMPSHFEGLPLTLVESQSVGLPAIASKNIDNDIDFSLGLIEFCDINSVENWTEKTLSALSNEKETDYNQIKEKFIEKEYDIESITSNLINIYSKTLTK